MAIILNLSALRRIEQNAAGATPPLMERAGAAASEVAVDMLAASPRPMAPLLIVCGPGNNGGDGFVVARLLKARGHEPMVIFAGAAERLPAAARAAHDAWIAAGGECLNDIPERDFALAIDAIFGIGLARPVEGRHAALIERLNTLDCPLLALDIPSGLDSESGRIHGVAVRATRTATFIGLKPGLLTGDGPDCCGEIGVHDLGIAFDATSLEGAGETITPALFRNFPRPRAHNSHKGSFGSVAILGGAPGMAGAALLAGRAALKLGAGRVYVGMLEHLAVDPVQPELMLREADAALSLASVIAIGPGLGQSDAALELLRRVINIPPHARKPGSLPPEGAPASLGLPGESSSADFPLVLDADALNLLATHPVLQATLARRVAATLLTPHPAEAARLLGITTQAVQDDRIGAARALSRRCNALVALKGCGTIIATPGEKSGRWWINTTGNAGLASAGSGDVLTGFVVALLAQGWPAEPALLAAVHLHGIAADALATSMGGNLGMTAGELIDPARTIFNRWIADAR